VGNIVIVPKYSKLGQGFSQKEIQKSYEHPGRQTNPSKGYQTPAAWLDDLGELKKLVLLCDNCAHKWNPKRYGYRLLWMPGAGTRSNGWCDSCKEFALNNGGGRAWVTEESYPEICAEPPMVSRGMRWVNKAKDVFDIITN